jgi:hypothetical protein
MWTGNGGPVVGCCGHGNEPSDSIKGWKFLDQLSGCQFLSRGSGRLVTLYGKRKFVSD